MSSKIEFHRQWDSFSDLIDTARRENWRDRKDGEASVKKYVNIGSDSTKRFCGVDSFDHALRLVDHGWPEGLEKTEPFIEALRNKVGGKIRRPAFAIGDEGDEFLLDRVIEGDPECWLATEWEEVDQAGEIVRIGVDMGIACYVSATSIVNRGAAIMAAVEMLMASGRSVQLDAFYGNSLGYYSVAKIKDTDDTFDRDRMAFVLVHPAMLRCILFSAWDNEDPAIFQRYVTPSYGSPTIPEKAHADYDMLFPGSAAECGWDTQEKAQTSIIKALEDKGFVESYGD